MSTIVNYVGTKLKAINQCTMEDEYDENGNPVNALTIGNEYLVRSQNEDSITILDDQMDIHDFTLEDLHLFFEI